MTKVIRKKLVDGEWVKTVINNQTEIDSPNLKKKKKVKKSPKKKKRAKKPRRVTNKFYKSHEFMRWRYEVMRRSKGRCELCGRSAADGVVLHADHIKPVHRYPELALDPNNGQTLCASCNWGKWGGDETDWRKDEKYWAGLTFIE